MDFTLAPAGGLDFASNFSSDANFFDSSQTLSTADQVAAAASSFPPVPAGTAPSDALGIFKQVTGSVRWEESVQNIAARGVTTAACRRPRRSARIRNRVSP